jgi:ElaB/YqjD/DUF883 family membrane-anchored ribosome-binding protein
MGEESSPRSSAVTGSDPEELQREIEATREQLGETVEALAEKADVKKQTKLKLEETRSQAREKLQQTSVTFAQRREQLMGKAKEVSPQTASSAASTATQKARENPMPVATVGAFAFGILVGRLTRT